MASIPPRPGLADAIAILQSIIHIGGGEGSDQPENPQFTIHFVWSRDKLRERGANHFANGPTPRYLIETLLELLYRLAEHDSRENAWSAKASAGSTILDCIHFLRFQADKKTTGPRDTAAAIEAKLLNRAIQYLQELDERRAAGGYSNPHEAKQKADSARWQWENSKEHEDFIKAQQARREKTSGQKDYTYQDQAFQGRWKKTFEEMFEEAAYYGDGSGKANGTAWWQVLGSRPDATKKEIEKAYRKLAKSYHPDRPGGSHEKMQQLNVARDIGLAGARE